MPIFSASSGIVIPGCAVTSASASTARFPVPLRGPGVPLLPRGFLVARGAAVVALFLFLEPRGRPGPRRAPPGEELRGAGDDPPFVEAGIPASAVAAASSLEYSFNRGFSSAIRSVISLLFASRKSVTSTFLPSRMWNITRYTRSGSETGSDRELATATQTTRLGLVRGLPDVRDKQ